MRMRPLGTGPARPAVAPPTPPAADTGPTTLYAAVGARDANGAPTHIELPGPLAGPAVGLYGQRDDGTVLWLAEVRRDGTVKSDGQRGHELARVRPGTRIVAATDAAGRVLALSAVVRVGAGKGKPRTRSGRNTGTGHTSTRSAGDRYAHDPNEVFIAGAGGRVLNVS